MEGGSSKEHAEKYERCIHGCHHRNTDPHQTPSCRFPPMMLMTEKQHAYNDIGDDNDHDAENETSSVTSSHQQEALCEMLGLPLSFRVLTLAQDEEQDADRAVDVKDESCAASSSTTNRMNDDDDDDDDHDERETAAAKRRLRNKPTTRISWINLPPNASRYYYPPSQCTAFCIPQLFTPQECRHWIDLAAAAGRAKVGRVVLRSSQHVYYTRKSASAKLRVRKKPRRRTTCCTYTAQ